MTDSRPRGRSAPGLARDPLRPPRTRGRQGALLLAGALILALGACTERGDLGRPRPSVLAETAVPALGGAAASLRGEPVSDLPRTDDETELHRRAWRFLMPSEEQGPFEQALADAVRTGLLPRTARAPDPESYHEGLMAGPFRSPASRYRRLGEDAAADAALAAPFATLALRVVEADRVRLAMLERVRPGPDRAEAALARIAENRCLIAWVREAAGARTLAYRHALAALVIEAPQGEAIGAERALATLDAGRRSLDALPGPGAVCAGGAGIPGPAPRLPPAAIVAKG